MLYAFFVASRPLGPLLKNSLAFALALHDKIDFPTSLNPCTLQILFRIWLEPVLKTDRLLIFSVVKGSSMDPPR